MNKKQIFIVIIILILTAALVWLCANWWQTKQLKIQQGLANDKFPYKDYTQEELNKMHPQIKNADVPTRTTPEQTYANFREALRMNNLDMAIEQLSKESEKYEENKKTLEQAHGEGKFLEAYKEYPEKIEKESMYESTASYYYLRRANEQAFKTHISFIKNSNGDWKIDIF
jgi:flagellar basal body-associated protein FliL